LKPESSSRYVKKEKNIFIHLWSPLRENFRITNNQAFQALNVLHRIIVSLESS